MKKIPFLILAFILLACASPPPTATLIPTPTLHPQFIEIQEQVASTGERFTLNQDGMVEDKTADGVTSVPGLKLDKNGVWRLNVGDQQVELKPAEVSFDDDKGINVAGYTLDQESHKWVVEPIKEYPICATENFRDCPVPVEDLFNGNYHRWLKTLSQPFDPEKIKFVPMEIDREAIIYETSTAPNYEDPETRPFRRNVTSAITELTAEDGRTYRYVILPVEYADPNDPGNPDKNIWVIGFTGMNKIDSKQNTIGKENDGLVQLVIDIWMNKMNIAPIVTVYEHPLTEVPIPLSQKTWEMVGDEEMADRMERFRQGDPSALDGLIVQLTIAYTTSGREIYK